MNQNQIELIKKRIDEVHYLRGKYLHTYADVEFLLLDIIDKVRNLEAYDGMNIKFQQSVSGRIKTVRKLISENGPLKLHCTDLESACVCLEVHSELRLYFAHGLSRLDTKNGDIVGMHYRRFNPTNSNDPWRPEFARFYGDDLKTTVEIACQELIHTMTNLRRIYGELKLEGVGPFGPLKQLDTPS